MAATALNPGHAAPAVAKSIVFVHSGFVDGSGWQGVCNILKMDGYNVSIVQNPTTSLAEYAAVKRRLATEVNKAEFVARIVQLASAQRERDQNSDDPLPKRHAL